MSDLISICLATYNGEKYIYEQLDSIICALEKLEDWKWEIIISDDQSIDKTLQYVKAFSAYEQIKIVNGPRMGIGKNFENAIKQASGKYIYLADQDDVWRVDRIFATIGHLKNYDFVVCNALVVNRSLDLIPGRTLKPFKYGSLKNFCKNTLTGALLGGRREALEKLLPFPEGEILHDHWIAVLAPLYGAKFQFLDDKLVLYRRHGANASSSSESSGSFIKIISNRLALIKQIYLKLKNT